MASMKRGLKDRRKRTADHKEPRRLNEKRIESFTMTALECVGSMLASMKRGLKEGL